MNLSEKIIFENDDFVAVNKPAGLFSIPDREGKEPSLKGLLQKRYGDIFTVHRLDKDTSGIILFARHEAAHKQLSQLFEKRDIEKYYGGLVTGKVEKPEGRIDAPIAEHPVRKGTMVIAKKGKPALTDYTVLETFKAYTWVQFRIYTGRTHQIRVHAKSIGHPVVCDDVYGDGKPVYISALKRNYKLSKSEEDERPILARLALHSWRLKFTFNEQSFALEADLPRDLKALLQQLRRLTPNPSPPEV